MRKDKLCLVVGVFLIFVSCSRSSKQPSPPTPAESPEASLERAKVLVKQSPSFNNVISLGLSYSKLCRHQEALIEFNHALDSSPKSPIALNNICVEHNELKQWKSAIEFCQMALAIEPTFVLAKNNLAFAEKSLADQTKKISVLEANIRSGKEADRSRIDLGMTYYSEGNYDQAIKIWTAINSSSKFYSVAQNDLGSAYIFKKSFDLSEACLKRAIALEPANQLFLNNLKWLNSVRH